jgi:integrase
MLLSDTVVRNTKPKEKMYRLKDGDGLFLQVDPRGGKYWRLRYFFGGKEKMLSFGTYPEVSLSEAREKRHNVRKLIAQNHDPAEMKKENKRKAVRDAENTFRAVAKEWHEANKAKWSPAHGAKILRRLELHVFAPVGSRVVAEIKPSELLEVLRKIEKQGTTEISHRVLQTCNAIFRYSIATGKSDYNPAADLQGALKAHKAHHYPALKTKEIPEFLRRLNNVQTTPMNKLAIRLLLLTFVRQGELRQAQWKDIDFEAEQWRLPPETTKMRDEHIVPLSKQALAILRELQEISGTSIYLFPSQNRQKNPIMSENTIGSILKKKMGYKGQMVGHGFRALASTSLNEMGFSADVIERQLAHAERNKVRAAYNRAQYLPERQKMMQWWGDYIENAMRSGEVVVRDFGKRTAS